MRKILQTFRRIPPLPFAARLRPPPGNGDSLRIAVEPSPHEYLRRVVSNAEKKEVFNEMYVCLEKERVRMRERERKSEKGCHGNHKNTANQKIIEFQ